MLPTTGDKKVDLPIIPTFLLNRRAVSLPGDPAWRSRRTRRPSSQCGLHVRTEVATSPLAGPLARRAGNPGSFGPMG